MISKNDVPSLFHDLPRYLDSPDARLRIVDRNSFLWTRVLSISKRSMSLFISHGLSRKRFRYWLPDRLLTTRGHLATAPEATDFAFQLSRVVQQLSSGKAVALLRKGRV